MSTKNSRFLLVCAVFLACSFISLMYAFWQASLLRTLTRQISSDAQKNAIEHTQTSVQYIGNLLTQAENAVERLARQNPRTDTVQTMLQHYKPAAVTGLGFAHVNDQSLLDGFYYVEHEDAQHMFSMLNREETTWKFPANAQYQGTWTGPLKDPYTGQQIFIYAQFIAPNLIIWATQSIEHIAHLLYTTQTKDISYWLILDAQNTIRYAPFPSMHDQTLHEVTSTASVPMQDIHELIEKPLSSEHATLQKALKKEDMNTLWITAQNIKQIGATLIGVYSEADLPLPRDILRRAYFHCITVFTLALVLALLCLLIWYWPQRAIAWICDLLIACSFIGAIVLLWIVAHSYPSFETDATPIFSKAELYRYLDHNDHAQNKKERKQQSAQRIHTIISNADELYYLLNYRYKKGSYVPTGILIHDISFESADQIGLVGYVWQRYFDGIHDGIGRGFMFPQLGASPTITEMSRSKMGKAEIILWHVSVTLNQTISYRRYPFDVKNLSIEIRHKDFEEQVVLVPDLDAYYLLNPTALPGISPHSHLSNWSMLSSFFGFTKTSLNTNFGIYSYGPYGTYYALDPSKTPSLTFNIAIQREIWNAIIDNLLMIAVIYLILFVLLITYAIQSFGWTLGTCTSTFFTTILAQIRFRAEIPSHEIVYFESFYFVLYATVVALLSLSLIGFYMNAFDENKRKEHQIIKLLYWPITLGTLFLLTIINLY